MRAGGAFANRRQWLVITALLGAPALLIGACSGATAKLKGAAVPASATRLTSTPANGNRNAAPNLGGTIVVCHGEVKDVSVTRRPDPLSGYVNAADTMWRSTWAVQSAGGPSNW